MGRCSIEKDYRVCEHDFNNLLDYLIRGNRARPVFNYIEEFCSSDVYHYIGCSLVITKYFNFTDGGERSLLADKLEGVKLKVVSDTDSLSEAVLKELEEILLNKKSD